MRIEVVKNYLSPEECAQLTNWTTTSKVNGLLTPGAMSNSRWTSRQRPNLYQYPQWILDLSNRIRSYCGVSNYPLLLGQGGSDGIVTNYTLPTGDIKAHTDTGSSDGLAALRCNVVTQQADAGGVLFVGGQEVPLEAGDLHCYLVSEYEHYVTAVEGNTVRVNWMFGAYLPANVWEDGQIVVGGQ